MSGSRGAGPSCLSRKPGAMAAEQEFFDAVGWLTKNAPKEHELGLAGLAELVHNAADADAQRLDIQLEHATKAGWEGKRLLSFADNGHGMEPADIAKMLKFGNAKERGTGEIGKWGVGFKNGTLRNCDSSGDARAGGALVFTRADASGTMSIALFSRACVIEKSLKCFPTLSFNPDMQPLARAASVGTTAAAAMEGTAATEASAAEAAKALREQSVQDGIQEAERFWELFDEYAPISRREAYRLLTSLPTVARDLDGRVSGTHVMVYGLSEEINFTAADGCDAPPDLIMRDVRDKMHGNGRAAVRSSASDNARYEVDFSFRAFLEVMFMAPPMVIYLRTDAAQSDSQAKVKTKQMVAGATGLQREKVITDAMTSNGDPLPLLLGYSDVEAEHMRGGIHLYWNNILVIPFFCVFPIKDGVIGVANVDFLSANPEKEHFETAGTHGRRWNSMLTALKQQVQKFEDGIFTETSKNNFELTDYDGPAEIGRDNWVQCERCSLWRKLPQDSDEIADDASWQCGQLPMTETRCYKSRNEDFYDAETDFVTQAQVHGAPVGSNESSVPDSEREQMKQHVKEFLTSNWQDSAGDLNAAFRQRIREAVEEGMEMEKGALSRDKTAKKTIRKIIDECVAEEEERASLCLRRNDWFLLVMSSSGKLGDVAFPPFDEWSHYFQAFSHGQPLMPVICRVLTVSVGITGMLELHESDTSACKLECFTLEHNRSVGVNLELPALAQATWLRRGKVNVARLSLATVNLLKLRLRLGSPMTRAGGNRMRMGAEDLPMYQERMLSIEQLRLEQIQAKEAEMEQQHLQKTPVQAAIERTFEEECRNRIPWAELTRDTRHKEMQGGRGVVSKYNWRRPADEGAADDDAGQADEGAAMREKMVAFKRSSLSEDWLSRDGEVLKREIHIARACSGLDGVISFLGIAFKNDDVESPKSLGLVYEWKEQNLKQLLESRGPDSPVVCGGKQERTMVSILLQIAAALEALHQQTPAIIHRDLKPSNVLIETVAGDPEQYRAFLCDFGSAKAVSSLTDLSNTGNVGTQVFQAPELASESRVTHKCDVYSFGVTAAQLALGIDVKQLESKLKLMISSPLPFQCSDDIQDMINNCMAISPLERPDFTAIKLKLSSMLQRDEANRAIDRKDIQDIRAAANGKAVVYRVLNDTLFARDVLQEGLTAGSPMVPTATAVEHVKNEKNVPKSPYISTTLSPEWALYYFAKRKLLAPYETCLIVSIDLDKLPTSCKVHWLNMPETRRRLGFDEGAGAVAKNFATSAYEVLIEPAATDPVPLSAITDVYRVQDMSLTENVRLFDKLKEGLQEIVNKKDGSTRLKYMSFNDWTNRVADFKRCGSNMTPLKVLKMRQEKPPLPKPVRKKAYSCNVGDKLAVLWVGNTACREDAQWLVEQQIGAIYQCRPPRVGCVRPLPDENIKIKTIALVDNSDKGCKLENMVTPASFFRPQSPALLEAMDWIWESFKTNGRSVLMHSTSGCNRALAVAFAFCLLVKDTSPVIPNNLEAEYKIALAELTSKKDRFLEAFKAHQTASVVAEAKASSSKQPEQQEPAQSNQPALRPPSANTAAASSSKQPAQQGKRKQPAGSNGEEPPHKAARHEDPFAHLSGSACDEQQASRLRASAEALVPADATGEAGTSAAAKGLPAFTQGVELRTTADLERSQLNEIPYFITWKAVGTTCALFVSDGGAFLFSAGHVRQLATPPIWGCRVQQLLIHGALVEEQGGMVFYVHDLLRLRGSLPSGSQCDIMPDTPFNERLEMLERHLVPRDGHQLRAGELVLKVKKHVKLKYAANSQYYDPASSQRILSCARDGHVLVPVCSRFERGTNERVLDWRGTDDDLKAWAKREVNRLPERATGQKSRPESRLEGQSSGVLARSGRLDF